MKYRYKQGRVSNYEVAAVINQEVKNGWEYVEGFVIGEFGGDIILLFREEIV